MMLIAWSRANNPNLLIELIRQNLAIDNERYIHANSILRCRVNKRNKEDFQFFSRTKRFLPENP